jgi:hypothetical protein
VSYTLRGRVESRLAATLVPFLAACAVAGALQAWWPLELAGLMLGVGLMLDVAAYHRLVPYQPGWLALPLGVGELALTMLAARAARVDAPLGVAGAFFAGSWLLAQVLGHAGLPFFRLTYAEDGGELGRGGRALAGAAPVALAAVLGVAWVSQPPLVRLAAGVHEGPLVLDSPQRLVGEPGAVVRGGIVIRSDDVTVRDLTVVGGQHGIDIEWSRDVLLEDVRVVGARLDGIRVRRGSVTIRGCQIATPAGQTQGIDISFNFDLRPSSVERCTVTGGREGIVAHSSHVRFRENVVRGTGMRGISVNEMSMGLVEDNLVTDTRGVAIYCGDYSHCRIVDNTVVGVTSEAATDNAMRNGYAIQAHFWARATLGGNAIVRSRAGVAAFADARLIHDD